MDTEIAHVNDEDEDEDGYPDLVVYDDDTGITSDGPVVTLLREGHTITNFRVHNDWKDDGEPCLGCSATINDTTFHFALLWLSFKGVTLAILATTDEPEYLSQLRDHIIDYADNMID